MNRKGFLKSLFALGATTMLPVDNILKATDFIEKKSTPKPGPFINHMTIQRKTVSITGSAKSDIIWYELDGNKVGFVHNPMFDGPIN